MNFILSVKNQSPLPFDYRLTKTSMIVKQLQVYEFEQKAVYNLDLLSELLLHGPVEKLNAFLEQLKDEHEITWWFIDQFVDWTAQPDMFIGLLAKKWSGMWAYISLHKSIVYERQLIYLKGILQIQNLDILSDQNKDECMARYFEQHDDIFQKMEYFGEECIQFAITGLFFKLKSIQTDNVSKAVLDSIFDLRRYQINITSREEKSKTLVDSDPGRGKGQKILKLRVKQVK